MKKWLMTVGILIIMLTGCGKKEPVPGEMESPSDSASVVEEASQTGTQDEEAPVKDANRVFEISEEKLTVNYEGEKFTTLTMGIGGDWIYISGREEESGEAFLGRIERGQATLERISLDGMEKVRAFRISVEQSGMCHVLWMGMNETQVDGRIVSQLDLSQSYITTINTDGSLKEKIDISEVVLENSLIPYHFVADKEGNFYLDKGRTIIKVGDNGKEISVIECDGTVECIGVGLSGQVYCTYYAGETTYLGKVEADKVVTCDVNMPQLVAKFAVMTAGVNTELLLYNREGGAYAFDGKTQIQERIANEMLPVSGEKVLGGGFMNDGRLCLAEQKESLSFYYVPVEQAQE